MSGEELAALDRSADEDYDRLKLRCIELVRSWDFDMPSEVERRPPSPFSAW